jgi:hypothetical protein
VNENLMFPWELKSSSRGEHLVGAISPRTVREYLGTFSRIDYGVLDQAFDFQLPSETRARCEIAKYRSDQVFSGYLRQWEDLFKYAAERDVGVLIHLG